MLANARNSATTNRTFAEKALFTSAGAMIFLWQRSRRIDRDPANRREETSRHLHMALLLFMLPHVCGQKLGYQELFQFAYYFMGTQLRLDDVPFEEDDFDSIRRRAVGHPIYASLTEFILKLTMPYLTARDRRELHVSKELISIQLDVALYRLKLMVSAEFVDWLFYITFGFTDSETKRSIAATKHPRRHFFPNRLSEQIIRIYRLLMRWATVGGF